MSAWLTPLVVVGTLLCFAVVRLWLARRYPENDEPLIDAVDALLPQTQCAQCGYPGCRPYAEAVVAGAPLNLCPPGGRETHEALAQLINNTDRGAPPDLPEPLLAVIDESACIGCALCLPACPVDAIVGAPNFMHTVITADCTGCELCVAPCPVDCIEMIEAATPVPALHRRHTPALPQNRQRPCIHCGRCEPVCPESLPAMTLLHLVRSNHLDEAISAGLNDCIDCSLCDNACPSEIPMARAFATAKVESQIDAARLATAERYKQRFKAHQIRVAEQARNTKEKRARRLQGKRSWD